MPCGVWTLEITNADLEALINDDQSQDLTAQRFKVVNVQVSCGMGIMPTATVTLRDDKDGVETTDACIGTGPVDAAFQVSAHGVREQVEEAQGVAVGGCAQCVAAKNSSVDVLMAVDKGVMP